MLRFISGTWDGVHREGGAQLEKNKSVHGDSQIGLLFTLNLTCQVIGGNTGRTDDISVYILFNCPSKS